MNNNEETLNNLEEAIRKGRDLLDQGHDRQDELNDLLAKLDELQAQAKNDVELTKATLKDANEIYKTLKGKIFWANKYYIVVNLSVINYLSN